MKKFGIPHTNLKDKMKGHAMNYLNKLKHSLQLNML